MHGASFTIERTAPAPEHVKPAARAAVNMDWGFDGEEAAEEEPAPPPPPPPRRDRDRDRPDSAATGSAVVPCGLTATVDAASFVVAIAATGLAISRTRTNLIATASSPMRSKPSTATCAAMIATPPAAKVRIADRGSVAAAVAAVAIGMAARAVLSRAIKAMARRSPMTVSGHERSTRMRRAAPPARGIGMKATAATTPARRLGLRIRPTTLRERASPRPRGKRASQMRIAKTGRAGAGAGVVEVAAHVVTMARSPAHPRSMAAMLLRMNGVRVAWRGLAPSNREGGAPPNAASLRRGRACHMRRNRWQPRCRRCSATTMATPTDAIRSSRPCMWSRRHISRNPTRQRGVSLRRWPSRCRPSR